MFSLFTLVMMNSLVLGTTVMQALVARGGLPRRRSLITSAVTGLTINVGSAVGSAFAMAFADTGVSVIWAIILAGLWLTGLLVLLRLHGKSSD